MEQTVRTFLRELETRADILGAALFGSYARGDARPDGDIDVFVLVADGVRRDLARRGDKTFEMLFASEKDAMAFYGQNPDDCVTTWEDARIVFDKDGGLLRLKEHAAMLRDSGKQRRAETDVLHRKFEAEDKLRAVRHLAETDMASAYMYLHELVQRFLEYRFDMIGRWTPPAKQRLLLLRGAEPQLATLFDEFYSLPSWNEKLEAAERVMRAVFEGAGS